jgi:hypothetical protein
MNFAKPAVMRPPSIFDRYRDQGPRTNPGMDRFVENQARRIMPVAQRILKPAVEGSAGNIPDILKPRFVINSLDKQNNLDRTQSIGDYKPIPAGTFNGAVLGRVLQ